MVPIGYQWGLKQMNFVLWAVESQEYTGLGLLVQSNMVKNPLVFYCPSRIDLENQFNVATNPWPPGSVPNQRTRASYGCRPVVDWGSPGGAGQVQPAGASARNIPSSKFPRLLKLKSKAILTDAISDNQDLGQTHQNGAQRPFRPWRRRLGEERGLLE